MHFNCQIKLPGKNYQARITWELPGKTDLWACSWRTVLVALIDVEIAQPSLKLAATPPSQDPEPQPWAEHLNSRHTYICLSPLLTRSVKPRYFSSRCLDFLSEGPWPYLFSIAVLNTVSKNVSGKKGFGLHFPGNSPLPTRRKSGQEPRAETRRKLQIGLFLTQSSTGIFIETRTTGQGMALPTVGWNLLH